MSSILSQGLTNKIMGGGVGDWIGETFGFRASGGPVSSGSPYIVGERGPELFVPSSSGNIVPNNALGGGFTIKSVNVINQTGSESSGATVQVKPDIDGYILNVVLNGALTNKGGFGEAMQALARG
jgi:hypothetical protein